MLLFPGRNQDSFELALLFYLARPFPHWCFGSHDGQTIIMIVVSTDHLLVVRFHDWRQLPWCANYLQKPRPMLLDSKLLLARPSPSRWSEEAECPHDFCTARSTLFCKVMRKSSLFNQYLKNINLIDKHYIYWFLRSPTYNYISIIRIIFLLENKVNSIII